MYPTIGSSWFIYAVIGIRSPPSIITNTPFEANVDMAAIETSPDSVSPITGTVDKGVADIELKPNILCQRYIKVTGTKSESITVRNDSWRSQSTVE